MAPLYPNSLFSGPDSLREPTERLAFWLVALAAFPAALLVGYALHESIGASQVALFIVLAMLYVTLARGRLLGSSVHVHQTQYPRVFEIVKNACAALEIPMPLIFVREDNNVPVVALGFGAPYALVLSSRWIEVFADDELSFMVGRELGHIAAGHTRFHSLLSVNGNENPLIALIFGAWLRRCALTCDKVGLLCCGSLDAAIRAMGVAAFHEFARRVDYQAFAEQQAEIQSDSILRWGEWLSGEPYATQRIASLRRFIPTTSYANTAAWFARERGTEPPPLAAPGEGRVVTRDCAGWWRRIAAWSIDAVIVSAIITAFGGNIAPFHVGETTSVQAKPGTVHVTASGVNLNFEGKHHSPAPDATPAPANSPSAVTSGRPGAIGCLGSTNCRTDTLSLGPITFSENGASLNWFGNDVPLNGDTLASAPARLVQKLSFGFWFPVYLALLVIVAGQTFGMMIAGLRVVTIDFRKPGIFRTLARYLIVGFLWWLIVGLSLIWRRILLHDRWTGTRLVKVERVVARDFSG
jgi:hypothetical protein